MTYLLDASWGRGRLETLPDAFEFLADSTLNYLNFARCKTVDEDQTKSRVLESKPYIWVDKFICLVAIQHDG